VKDFIMQFQPLFNRVILKRFESKLLTAGGVHLSEMSPESINQEAMVLAVGPGMPNADGSLRASQVSVGDKVLLLRGQGVPLKIEGEDVILVDEPNIIGILQKASTSSGD
jgi:chaperonin GroES